MRPSANRDRAVAYGTLARMFLPPDASRLAALKEEGLPDLRLALGRMGGAADLLGRVERLAARIDMADLEKLGRAYEEAFDPSCGLQCPPTETAWTAITPQHALVKNFELADIAGFYRAFGVEVTPGTERPDHIAAELEFMHLLAVKELAAAGRDDGEEHARICHDASAAFLRDHLGRWFAPFCERLQEAGGPVYREAAGVLEGFLRFEQETFH